MAYRFHKHYTLEEARKLLPKIRKWLAEIRRLTQELQQLDKRLAQLVSTGADAGGESVHRQLRLRTELSDTFQEFEARQIQVKDLERGLVDFPAIIAGREAFLCWEEDEEDIEFWHDLDTGYAGRSPL
jgi:hypothetical protein